jgi:hypothetical protein
LQPDSLIPDPVNPQNLNRFSYVGNNPVNFSDPSGHSYTPPCIFCNIQWFDYSNTPLILQGVLDFATVGACLFLGCNADPYSHTVSGPTMQQHGNNLFILPMADVILPVENPAPLNLLYTDPDGVVSTRASEIQSALPARTANSVTMASGIVEDANGYRRLVLSSSEPNGYIRPDVTKLVLPDEFVIQMNGHQHAEINMINWAKNEGLKLINISAGRSFCPTCRKALEDIFAEIGNRLAR